MTTHVRFAALILVVFMLSVTPCVAVDSSPTSSAPVLQKRMPPPPPLPRMKDAGQGNVQQGLVAFPTLEKVGPGFFRLGNITIHKPSLSISFPAVVNMDKGLLEYLLVYKGGKTHESLFRTEIDPTSLQVAMLLVGLEGTDRPLARQGDPEKPQGNPVDISVSYLKGKEMFRLAPEEWIARKSADGLLKSVPLEWVFTGSVVLNGRFLAKEEGSIISLYHDPAALVDNASIGGENDRIWFVGEGVVPSVGTEVLITISARH